MAHELQNDGRRRFMGGAALRLAGALAAPHVARAQGEGKIFVLVHGGWRGGWCWRPTADILTSMGHSVFTPTLTGLGEREHLLSEDITLDTHTTDVVDVFEFERLVDVVLVGHSAG